MKSIVEYVFQLKAALILKTHRNTERGIQNFKGSRPPPENTNLG